MRSLKEHSPEEKRPEVASQRNPQRGLSRERGGKSGWGRGFSHKGGASSETRGHPVTCHMEVEDEA